MKSDSRVHPRFTNILRTGRVSCSSPNIQNLPSRDKVYPLKNVYTTDPGYILCATDYSFLELVALAESCLTRFGESVMADIINAGVDPHRWFAGVRSKIIDSKTDFCKDPKAVEEMNEFLKANISKELRQTAKACNFGLPGGMGAKSFRRNCCEQGVIISLEEAEELRNTWIKTFKEMRFHMKPEKLTSAGGVGEQFGFGDEDDPDAAEIDASEKDRQMYRAVLINGMVRTRCSYNAAQNVQFQGLAAYGVKLAMWNLAMAGFLPRMRNMIHDLDAA